MKIYAILGHPVSHSLSPKLHNAVFHEMGLEDRTYEFCDVVPEKLEDALEELRKGKYRGFSVTIPYKQTVMNYLEEVSERAKKIGAVNTILLREDGTLFGDNTDYFGFAKSLEEAGVLLTHNEKRKTKNALVLGSGGAAQAVIEVLHDHGYQVTVATRRKSKDDGNIEGLKDVALRIVVKGYDELDPNGDFQMIVNTTPVGMGERDRPPSLRVQSFGETGNDRKDRKEGILLEEDEWYRADRVYVDVVYTPKMTPFLKRAHKVGAKIVMGDRMFLWQAVEQSKYFTEREEVPVAVMERVLASLAF